MIGRDLQPISAHTNTVCSGLPVCGLTLQCVDLEIGKLKSPGFSVGSGLSLCLSVSPLLLFLFFPALCLSQCCPIPDGRRSTGRAKLKYLITIHQYNSNIMGRLKDNSSVTISFISPPLCYLYPCFTERGDSKALSQTDKRNYNHFLPSSELFL